MDANRFEKIKKAAIASLNNPGGSKKPLPKKESEKYSILYVFRHTQTNDNINRIFSGRRDSKLTAIGVKQAKELAEKLRHKRIDLFIIPPLSRCAQTIKPIAKYHTKADIITEKFLIERDYGILTGKNKLKLMKQDFRKTILYRRAYDYPPPKGESLKDVWQKRLSFFCKKLNKQLVKQKINIAVCCTNNTMRLVRMYFEKLSIEQMLTIENPFADYSAYIVKDMKKS